MMRKKAEEEDVPVDAEGSVQKGEEFHNAFKEIMEENEEEEGEMEPEKSVAAIMVDQIREEERASVCGDKMKTLTLENGAPSRLLRKQQMQPSRRRRGLALPMPPCAWTSLIQRASVKTSRMRFVSR